MKKTLTLALSLLICLTLLPAGALAKDLDNLNPVGTFPIVKDKITLKIFGQQGGIHADWSQMDLFTHYQELTNIDLDFRTAPLQGYAEQKNLMFVSGDYPDIIVRGFLTPSEIIKYGGMGTLLPLEDMLAEYAPNFSKLMEQFPEMKARIISPDGHIYALPAVIEMAAARTDKIWVNTKWLKKVNLEVPTNFDELEAMIKAFKTQDPNGNGEADEIPIAANSFTAWVQNFVGMWGLQRQFDQSFNLTEDGKLKEWLTSGELLDLLKWSNKLYKEGLFDNDMFTQEYSKYNAKMSGQVMGLFFNQADDAFDSTDYVGIAPFAGKSDKIYVRFAPVARDLGTFAITTSCEYPHAALLWQDYFYSAEGSYLMRYGIEGKTWTRDAEGYPVYKEGILDNPNGSGPTIAQFTIWPGGGAPQYLNDHNSIAVTSKTTAAAQVALDPYMDYTLYAAPLFDEATNERLMILENDINTYFWSSAAQFVTGDLSFDQWDNYCETLRKMGIDEWVSIYQNVLDSLK